MEEEIKTKVCSRCHEEKLLTEFSKNKNTKDGLMAECKLCRHEMYLLRTSDIKQRRNRQNCKDGFKICTKCGIEKPISEFYKDKYHKDGLRSSCKECDRKFETSPLRIEYMKNYREENREEIKIKKKEYYYNNIDVISANNAIYRLNHKEEKKNYDREYVKRDPEYQKARRLIYRLTHEESLLQYWREYNWNHKEEKQVYNANYLQTHKQQIYDWVVAYRKTPEGAASVSRSHNNRRYKEKGAENTLTAEQWNKILELQNYICPICERQFTDALPPTKDHIIPAYFGGGLTFGNTQALCQSCNSKKHIKVEFMRAVYTLLVNDI